MQFLPLAANHQSTIRLTQTSSTVTALVNQVVPLLLVTLFSILPLHSASILLLAFFRNSTVLWILTSKMAPIVCTKRMLFSFLCRLVYTSLRLSSTKEGVKCIEKSFTRIRRASRRLLSSPCFLNLHGIK